MPTLSTSDQQVMEQLNRHPHLKARTLALLSIVEDAGDDLVKASDAEQRVIKEMRRMGNEALTDWAEGRNRKAVPGAPAEGAPLARRAGKKNSVGTAPSAKLR